MDDENVKILWALREVNKTLITGLEAAIHYMERWDGFTPERRQNMIKSLKGLVEQSNKAYGTEPTNH